MKDFIDQAKINKVELLSIGNCQFCGAAFEKGIFECMDYYAIAFENIDLSEKDKHLFRFLSVDSHALQHPEIHGRWSNHFHLSRLHLILKEQVNWTYSHSPLLSDFINEYKKNKKEELLTAPPPQQRGKIRILDFKFCKDEKDIQELVLRWAEDVYHSWAIHHPIIELISKDFLKSKSS